MPIQNAFGLKMSLKFYTMKNKCGYFWDFDHFFTLCNFLHYNPFYFTKLWIQYRPLRNGSKSISRNFFAHVFNNFPKKFYVSVLNCQIDRITNIRAPYQGLRYKKTPQMTARNSRYTQAHSVEITKIYSHTVLTKVSWNQRVY